MGHSKRYTPKTWAKVQAEYEAGTPLPELSERFGPTKFTISRKAKAEGWGAHGSMKAGIIKAAQEKSREALAKTYQEQAEEAAARHTADAATARAIIMAALEDIQTKGVKAADARDINTLVLALKNTQDMERRTLRMDDIRPDGGETDFDRFIVMYGKHMYDYSPESGIEGID